MTRHAKRPQMFEIRKRQDGRIASVHCEGTKSRAEQRGRAVGHVISVRKVQRDHVLGNIEGLLRSLVQPGKVPPVTPEPETTSLEDMFFHQPKRRRENRAEQKKYAEEV